MNLVRLSGLDDWLKDRTQPTSWGITNCRVIDVDGGKEKETHHLAIQHGQIVTEELDSLANNGIELTIDAEGTWICPGYIDAHAHVFGEGDPVQYPQFRFDEDLHTAYKRAVKNLSKAIANGVTTIRDCGSFEFRALHLLKGPLPTTMPQIITCGSFITNTHETILAYPPAKTKEAVLATIDRNVSHGSHFVKIANFPLDYGSDILVEAVNCIHAHRKMAVCHVGDKASTTLAMDAGFDTIEHGVPYSDIMAKQMAQSGQILVPTMVCAELTCSDPERSFVSQPDLNQWFYPWRDDLRQFLPLAFHYGITLAAGSDAGYPPLDFGSVHDELSLFIQFGATPAEALRAATLNGAKACGLANFCGEIAINRRADLVFLASNPLERIDPLRQPLQVVVGGTFTPHAC